MKKVQILYLGKNYNNKIFVCIITNFVLKKTNYLLINYKTFNPMKIKLSELKTLIKEEVLRYNKIKTLEERKAKIEKELIKEMYLNPSEPEDKNQLKIKFPRKGEYNGIVYFSPIKNPENVYYIIYLLNESEEFLEYLDINSVGIIKQDAIDIADDVEKATGLEVPLTDTEFVGHFSKRGEVIAYGFKVDGQIKEEDIPEIIRLIKTTTPDPKYPSRTYKFVKIEKQKLKSIYS